MYYLKKYWNETRGDEHNNWGTSVWWFEVDEQRYPIRQIEVYQNGTVIRYDQICNEDTYGRLSDVPFTTQEVEEHHVSKEEFETLWLTSNALNFRDASLHKQFSIGDRVQVSSQGGWREDFCGVIVNRPQLCKLRIGTDFEYCVLFDSEQHDLSDDGPYFQAIIGSQYLQSKPLP